MPQNTTQQKLDAFERLLKIMDELRAQCPWDKEQTFDSLRHLTIEETYELADAILKNDQPEIKKEIGDLLLHVVFYAKMGDEMGHYDIADVIHALCDKLIIRHPHIYGDTKVTGSEQVKQNWEQIKLKEGNKSVLAGVPQSMPALIKAMRMQEKAAQVGFDWDHDEQVWEKVEEEWQELKAELKHPGPKTEEEFGDLLFALINAARRANINPDTALERTNEKFKTRFQHIEKRAKEIGKGLTDMTLEEMDGYWNEAKGLRKS